VQHRMRDLEPWLGWLLVLVEQACMPRPSLGYSSWPDGYCLKRHQHGSSLCVHCYAYFPGTDLIRGLAGEAVVGGFNAVG